MSYITGLGHFHVWLSVGHEIPGTTSGTHAQLYTVGQTISKFHAAKFAQRLLIGACVFVCIFWGVPPSGAVCGSLLVFCGVRCRRHGFHNNMELESTY